MAKYVYFMGGMPRSGSTLLGAILNQNKKLHVSTTSDIPDMVYESAQQTNDKDWYSWMYTMLRDKYKNHDYEFIIDKARTWNMFFPDLCKKEENPRMIAPIRPIKEVVASAIRLFEKNPQNLFSQFVMGQDRDQMAMTFYELYCKSSFESIRHVIETYPDNICVVDFYDLMHRTEKVIGDVYKFCSFPLGDKHDLGNIKVREHEDDKIWDIKGLHDVKPKIVPPMITPENYFGKELSWFLDNADTLHQNRGIIV